MATNNPFITAIDKVNNRVTTTPVATTQPNSNPFITAIHAVNTPQVGPIQTQQIKAAPVSEQVKTDQNWYQKLFSNLNRLKERAGIGATQALGSIQNTGGILTNKFAQVEQGRIDRDPYAPKNKPVQDPKYNQLSKAVFGSENAISQGLYDSTVAGKETKRIQGYKDLATQQKEAGARTFINAKQKEEEFIKKNGEATGFQWFAEQVAQSTPSFLANFGIGAAAGLITKNPVLAVSLGFGASFAQSTGQAYQDAKDFGLSDERAEDVAIVSGSAQALIETLPIGKAISNAPAGEQIEKALTKEIIKDIIAQGGVEGGTEALQTLVDNALKRTYNDNQDLFEGVPESFIVGAGMGIAADATIKAGEVTVDKVTNQSHLVDPKTIEKANTEIKEAIQTPANERTEFQQNIVDTLYTQELTPKQVQNKVGSDPELAKTELGEKLLKMSIQAEEQGKLVQIKGGEDESTVDINLVDKKDTQLKLPIDEPSKVKEKASAPKLEKAKPTNEAERYQNYPERTELESYNPDAYKGIKPENIVHFNQGQNPRVTLIVPEEVKSMIEAGADYNRYIKKDNGKALQDFKTAVVSFASKKGISEDAARSQILSTYEEYKAKAREAASKKNPVILNTVPKGEHTTEVKTQAKPEPVDRTKLTDKQLDKTNEQLAANKQKGVTLKDNETTNVTADNPKHLGQDVQKEQQSNKSTTDAGTKGVNKSGSQKTEQTPVGTGEETESRAYKRVRDRLDEATQTDVNYNRLNLEQDTKNALEFITSKPEDALRVAFGMNEAPKGQTETAISIALADKAGRDGKFRLQSQLEASRSLRQTRRGQEIVSERGRFNENSPYRFIQEIMDRRLKELGANSRSDIKDIISKEGSKGVGKSVKEKAVAKIDAEAAKLKERIKKDQGKIKLAQDIIDSLRC